MLEYVMKGTLSEELDGLAPGSFAASLVAAAISES